MNSVERIAFYTHDLPQEAVEPPEGAPPLPDEWPQHGALAVEDLSVRYRPKLPLVLREVSFTVEPGQRVAVVGRSGAGKSTMMLALFRLVEATAGRIRIDGVDIASLGLQQLRARLAIIPQDPVLWSCSIRDNLDPLHKCTDAQLWAALEKVQLKGPLSDVAVYPQGLDEAVAEGGANFSVGQRQLFCIARALLRNSKVLLLDEATASIDRETDRIIQKMIRTAFGADTTILTIAHRLNTIADFDRILVLDGGRLVEYGAPAALLAAEGGAFWQLASATGATSFAALQDIANGRRGALEVSDITIDKADAAVTKQDAASAATGVHGPPAMGSSK